MTIVKSLRRLTLAVTTTLALALPAAAETLADALIAAYRNSNLLDQNRALLRAADEDVAVAVASLRPVLSFVAEAGYASVRPDLLTASVGLSAQITLYDFGRGDLAVEAAKESVLATREALVQVEQQVLLNAVQAYVNLRLSQEVLALRQANQRLITSELRAAQDRFDLGETTRTDVALAEARLAAARSQLVQAEGDLMIAREDYKLAVGSEPGNLAPLPAPPRIPATLDEARGVAERTHPLVRQAQREVTVAELNVARAKAGMRPNLGAQATIGVDDLGNTSRTAGIELSQTLYAGGRLSALYRQAVAGRDASRAGLLQQVAVIQQAVGEAWANLAVAAASIEASDREIRATRTAFESVREEAALGARTTLDVLDAEQDVLTARTNRLAAEAQRYIGVYVLLAQMGLLTVDHLGLGIPTYDPAAYYNAVRNAPATSTQGRKLDRVLEAIGKQ